MDLHPPYELYWRCSVCHREVEPEDMYCDCGEIFPSPVPLIPKVEVDRGS